MKRDRRAGSEQAKPRAFSQPCCRRGTRCLAVLRTSPHTGTDVYGLIFPLGSVQEVPMSYIALHLSSTESVVENHFPLQESSGSRGQRRKNSDGGEKRNTSFPCGHQRPISLPSPWGWSLGSPFLPRMPDRRDGRVTHSGPEHTGFCLGPFCNFPLCSQRAWGN